MLDGPQLVSDAIHRRHIVGMDTQRLGARVVADVHEVFSGQTEVDRDEDRANLRHPVERLELLVGVRGDVCHAVAGRDAHRLQRRRPAVAPVEELLIGQPQVTVDDALAVSVKLACPARELERSERGFHQDPPITN